MQMQGHDEVFICGDVADVNEAKLAQSAESKLSNNGYLYLISASVWLASIIMGEAQLLLIPRESLHGH